MRRQISANISRIISGSAGKSTNRGLHLKTCETHLFDLYLLARLILAFPNMADTLHATLQLERLGPTSYKAQPFFERARAGNAQPIA